MAISLLITRGVGESHLAPLVKAWVRNVFQLEDSVTVMVTELQCMEPGCPPVETVVAIMDQPGRPKQYKLHKAMPEVTLADIEELRNTGFDSKHNSLR